LVLRGTKCVPRAKTNESLKPVAFVVVPQECTGFYISEGPSEAELL
jgi:hypothetical protein